MISLQVNIMKLLNSISRRIFYSEEEELYYSDVASEIIDNDKEIDYDSAEKWVEEYWVDKIVSEMIINQIDTE